MLTPVSHLLLDGVSPRRLAWSLAVGVAIGLNPLIGSSTLALLAVTLVFRLNVVAAQLANYLVYPLQLALVFVFLRAGTAIFHSELLPLTRADLLQLAHHPIAATRLLWHWEWHALLVWLACAAVVTPWMAAAMMPALRGLLRSLHPPVVED